MSAYRLKVDLYVGTPNEVEARKRQQMLKDTLAVVPSVKFVMLKTTTPAIYAVATELQYREDIVRYTELGFEVERFFEAPTGVAPSQLKRVI